MANVATIIANRGYFYTPHLVKSFKDDSKIDQKYRIKNTVNVQETYFEPIISGMEAVMSSGTGDTGFIPNMEICGKTGTVQNYKGEDHSVLIAFAPRRNPKIAVAVYVENGGWGSDYAAPIASLIIEKYITGYIRPFLKYRENKMRRSIIFPHNDYLMPWLKQEENLFDSPLAAEVQ